MKSLLRLFVFLTAAFGGYASEFPKPADDCCKAPVASTAPLTRSSVYQIDASFTNDAGRPVSLAEFRGRPVVLTLFFANCGYACPLLVAEMKTLRDQLPPDVRAQTLFVLVSFDSVRDTPAALATYRTQHTLDSPWVLLHGNKDSVRELAALTGVKYKQEADGSFAHSNLLTLLNPEGEIVHQRIGLKGGLDEAARALVASLPPVSRP